MEAGAYACDTKGINPKVEPLDFQAAIGTLCAMFVISNFPDSFSVALMTNIISKYCSPVTLASYTDRLAVDEIELDPEKSQSIDGIMDIRAMALQGLKIGWRKEWCPFAGVHKENWNDVFDSQ